MVVAVAAVRVLVRALDAVLHAAFRPNPAAAGQSIEMSFQEIAGIDVALFGEKDFRVSVDPAYLPAHLFELVDRHEVGLVDQNDVRVFDLSLVELPEHRDQLGELRRVHHGDERADVDRELHRRIRQRVGELPRLRHARRLDDDPFHVGLVQLLDGQHQRAAQGTAKAARVELDDVDAVSAQDIAIDADFAELVHDNRGLDGLAALGEQPPDQGRLARPEKAEEKIDPHRPHPAADLAATVGATFRSAAVNGLPEKFIPSTKMSWKSWRAANATCWMPRARSKARRRSGSDNSAICAPMAAALPM